MNGCVYGVRCIIQEEWLTDRIDEFNGLRRYQISKMLIVFRFQVDIFIRWIVTARMAIVTATNIQVKSIVYRVSTQMPFSGVT